MESAGRARAASCWLTLQSGTVNYGYREDGRLASVEQPGIGTFGFIYLDDGRLESISRPNGVTTTNGYDPAGRLTSDTHRLGTSVLASSTYTGFYRWNRDTKTLPYIHYEPAGSPRKLEWSALSIG